MPFGHGFFIAGNLCYHLRMTDDRQNKITSFLLILLAAILGSGAAVFGKVALREIPPLSFTFLRFLIASLFVLPFFIKSLKRFRLKDYKIILLSLLASANVGLFAFGIRFTTADTSAIIYCAVPIISAVFSFRFLEENFSLKKILGISVGLVGVLLVVLLPVVSADKDTGSLWGNLIICAAATSISLYWVFSKRFHDRYSPFEINGYFMFTTAILLFFLSLSDMFKNPAWWTMVSSTAYASLLFVAVFCTAVFYLISQTLVKKVSPTFASMFLYLQPFATFVMSYFVLSETLTLPFVVGAVLSLGGVWLYNSSQ